LALQNQAGKKKPRQNFKRTKAKPPRKKKNSKPKLPKNKLQPKGRGCSRGCNNI
jgi:hypothetical protein